MRQNIIAQTQLTARSQVTQINTAQLGAAHATGAGKRPSMQRQNAAAETATLLCAQAACGRDMVKTFMRLGQASVFLIGSARGVVISAAAVLKVVNVTAEASCLRIN